MADHETTGSEPDETVPLLPLVVAMPSHPFDTDANPLAVFSFAALAVREWVDDFGPDTAQRLLAATEWSPSVRCCIETAWGG